MKKIYLFGLATAMGLTALTGCIEEIDPQSSTVTFNQAAGAPGAFDNFVDNVTGNLVGNFIYRDSRNGEDYVWDFGYPSFYLSRDVMGQDIVPVGTSNWYDTWYQNVEYLSTGWAYCQYPITTYFSWVKDCNTVIKMAGASGYTEPAEDFRAGAGIAYAIRAMVYLDMARIYAAAPYAVDSTALTITKTTETTEMGEATDNPRMTWGEAFAFIEADLNFAETLLADYHRADVYTPDVSVVYGLKARLYLEWQDWANAEHYAKLAEEGYSIMSEEQYTSRDYGFNTPNGSWIFGVTFRATDSNILDNDGDSSWGSVMCLENGFECGYAANYGGPNVIDRHLYESIPATDFRRKCFVDFSLDDLIPEEDDGDKTAVYEALRAYTAWPERVYNAGVVAAAYGLGGLSLKFRNAAGMADVKYAAWVVAVPVMRVEEMKLIEAEAAGMQDESRGIQLLTEFATTRDPNYVYGRHSSEAYYNTATSAFQNEVWWQRRVELWGEGFATFDIKRLNKGIIRSYAGTNHVEGSRFNVESVPGWMNWCIGGTDNDYNKALLNNNNPAPIRPDGDSPEYVW